MARLQPSEVTATELRDDHHVVRYCRRLALDNSGRPTLVAFELRNDESYLSTHWLEYFENTPQSSRIDQLRQAISERLSLGATGRLLELRVHAVREAGSSANCTLHIALRDNRRFGPSHAGIDGWRSPEEHALVAERLLEIAMAAPLHVTRP